ncbi:RidA family protein [Ruminiclostridium cellobioparum]|jgi:2-iminobutanoate/2-iminopropanoate deaminase|uniref:Endoribonuclease L-PSP, putative n=1 Tax=Ruminiclostridium cellobioparum subsp. termitidis CT1112 TaxID=1195236 RepID=S0FQX8_RUMCE|nr:RidA family protein [Ruminiclostridium cellobioparum]EMS74242.1 endoribonuclease L-PSP, putative [Ruminiclostridium cellobioparum subsp. termitidis CT1112]
MSFEIISTDKAPAAIGPYSQAVKVGNFVYTSGAIPVDPKSGEVVAGGVAQQAEQAIRNLAAVLAGAGAGLDKVIKTTVFIKDMNDFAVINEVYKKFFTSDFPARSCVEVARLPKDVLIEIECVAVI